MAQTNAYNLFKADGTTEEVLMEGYSSIVDQIQKSAKSIGLKNTSLSGDPRTGSVVVRRLETSLVKAYGTARTAAAGDAVKNNGVTINLSDRKEVVEEVNNFDVIQFGLSDMIARRASNFGLSVARYLDSAFFAEAEAEGTEVTITASTVVGKVEELIQALEVVSNDNVDGVDRDLMVLSLTPSIYGELENYIDTLPNANGVDINMFHGVEVISNTRQTEEAIVMVKGAIAQPMAIQNFSTEEIPLTNDTGMKLFFNTGVQAVMPDLIMYATFTPSV